MEQELVGRDVEVARINALIDHTPRGGGVLIAAGEPGIGKSALLRVAADYARDAGFSVLESTGIESESKLPYSSVNQLLSPVLDYADRLPRPQRRALAVALGREDGDPPGPFLVALAVLNLLSELAGERPVLAVIDDAQWLDEPSRDVLTFLVRRVSRDAIAVLGAVRTGYRRLRVPDLPVLDVGPLDDSSARDLLAVRAEDLTAVERERILRDALGNPLALVELPAAWRGTPHPPAEGFLPLTQRLEEAFAGRISELPPLTRDALLVVAIEDGDGLPEILAATASLAGERVSVDDLDGAVAAGLLRFDELHVRFRHPLVRSAVLQAESMPRCQRAHAAVASLLADDLYRRTWHRAHAIVESDDEVADDLDSVHRTALARGSVVSAIWALERSAQLTTDLPRRSHRLLLAAEYAFSLGRRDKVDQLLEDASPLQLSDLDRARMEWLREIFDDGVPSDAGRVLELCTIAKRSAEAGDDDLALNLLHAAALRCGWSDTGPLPRARVLAVLDELRHLEDNPQYVAALALAEPLFQAGRVTDRLSRVVIESVTDADALWLFGQSAHIIGDPVRALDFLSRAETKLREQGRLGVLSQVLTLEIAQHVELGSWYVVESIEAEARSLAHETGQSLWSTGSMVLEALTAGLRGDNERAQALAGEVERFATSRRLNLFLTVVQLARGYGWMAASRYPEAFDALVPIFNPADPSYHAVERSRGVMFLAEAAVRAGRTDQARTIVAELEQAALITPSPTLHVQLSYARAVLADDNEAESRYLAALSQDLVRRPWARAQLELAYGSWLRRQRRVAESRSLLRTAYATLTAIGATTWAEQARAELRAAGERATEQTPLGHELLSPQEMQIARLAADGLSNREIGERLFLSHRTVGSHLYRIFPKLGITSRGQLSARLKSA